MKADEYLRILSKNISNRKMRKEICMEMRDHISDQKQTYVRMGYSDDAAEEAAVKDMGDPNDAGRMLDCVHPPAVDWIQVAALVAITLTLQLIKWLLEFDGSDFLSMAPVDILRITGIFLSVYAVIWIAVEKYLDLPFFYGRSQRGGSNANGVFICSLGIVLMSHSFLHTTILLFVFAPIIIVERYIVESKRVEKEQKFLWQKGIAADDFNYKGTGLFNNDVKTVYSECGPIEKGSPITIVRIDGFSLVVKKTDF